MFYSPGLVYAQYGYSYGKHFWTVKIQHVNTYNIRTPEEVGILKIGVTSKQGRFFKVIGRNLNYSFSKGEFMVYLALDCESRALTIFSSGNLKGEVIADLPMGVELFPAIQNKTQQKNSASQLKTTFSFEIREFNYDD